MLTTSTRHTIDLDTLKLLYQLLDGSSISYLSNLFKCKVPINLLNIEQRNSLHTKSLNFNLYCSNQIYDQSFVLIFLLRVGELEFERRETLLPSKHTTVFSAHLFDEQKNNQSQDIISSTLCYMFLSKRGLQTKARVIQKKIVPKNQTKLDSRAT